MSRFHGIDISDMRSYERIPQGQDALSSASSSLAAPRPTPRFLYRDSHRTPPRHSSQFLYRDPDLTPPRHSSRFLYRDPDLTPPRHSSRFLYRDPDLTPPRYSSRFLYQNIPAEIDLESRPAAIETSKRRDKRRKEFEAKLGKEVNEPYHRMTVEKGLGKAKAKEDMEKPRSKANELAPIIAEAAIAIERLWAKREVEEDGAKQPEDITTDHERQLMSNLQMEERAGLEKLDTKAKQSEDLERLVESKIIQSMEKVINLTKKSILHDSVTEGESTQRTQGPNWFVETANQDGFGRRVSQTEEGHRSTQSHMQPRNVTASTARSDSKSPVRNQSVSPTPSRSNFHPSVPDPSGSRFENEDNMTTTKTRPDIISPFDLNSKRGNVDRKQTEEGYHTADISYIKDLVDDIADAVVDRLMRSQYHHLTSHHRSIKPHINSFAPPRSPFSTARQLSNEGTSTQLQGPPTFETSRPFYKPSKPAHLRGRSIKGRSRTPLAELPSEGTAPSQEVTLFTEKSNLSFLDSSERDYPRKTMEYVSTRDFNPNSPISGFQYAQSPVPPSKGIQCALDMCLDFNKFLGEATEPYVRYSKPYKIQLSAIPHGKTDEFRVALSNIDYKNVYSLLTKSFKEVAVGEYSWLSELKLLGVSIDDMAKGLLEKTQYGPWIFSQIEVLDTEVYHEDFHVLRCLHSRREATPMLTISSGRSRVLAISNHLSQAAVRENIEYYCGVGGVSPMPDGQYDLQFGTVAFENDYSTAIISCPDDRSFPVFPCILEHLGRAIGTLQQVGGCCNSFTFLVRRECFVETERIDLYDVKAFTGNRTTSTLPTTIRKIFEPLVSSTALEIGKETSKDMVQQLPHILTAQFLSLAFALYSQGHCEPFSPFYLYTSLKRVLLIGSQSWGPSFTGPCILASPVDLTCFGDMLQRRVFAFQYFESFDRSKVFADLDCRLDLKARPEDLLDTWGPGEFIMSKDDSDSLHAISIGGGLIIPNSQADKAKLPVLHWSRTVNTDIKSTSLFPRHEKLLIGTRVTINKTCNVTTEEQIRVACPWLKDLGTFPSYWEVCERQLGLGFQGGQCASVVANFAQTWVKRLGQTKKSLILAERSLSIYDLEGHFGVQVSFCTGIARRVRLRELLADILPTYVEERVTQPRHWNRLVEDFSFLEMLRADDFRQRFERLDFELKAEFETLAIAVLFLLQDTGVDREGRNFVIGFIQPKLAVRCFQVPIVKESSWVRMAADSLDIATFAVPRQPHTADAGGL
ncbi:hypothetical protein FLONG3_5751 [Fusarium longipes]|uniref:Uncharacterized protein n=1 Tax=Fusarium longipes TaxID=694270 RepID=A0A395SSB9_9HYPO|nr:hypothetical protein FLONG3_5751 [Fusarium longipes]